MAEILCTCPYCDKRKAYINDGKMIGWCQRCKIAFTRSDIEEYGFLGSSRGVIRWQGLPQQIPSLGPAWADLDASRYLLDRNVQPEIAEAYGITYAETERRVYIPIKPVSPEFKTSYHTRGVGPKGTWICRTPDKSNYIFGNPCQGRVVLVEGIFDALNIGPGAVALLGTDLYESIYVWIRLLNPLQVLIWMDPDKPGQEAAKKIFDRLKAAGLSAITVPPNTPEAGDLPPNHVYFNFLRSWLDQTEKRKTA